MFSQGQHTSGYNECLANIPSLVVKMTDLLLSETPTLPPGSRARAIVMRCNYAYDDSASHIPEYLRNKLPPHLKKDGVFRIYKDDEGFVYNTNANHQWGLVFLVRNGRQIHGWFHGVLFARQMTANLWKVVIPISHMIIGSEFRPLAEKLADHFPIVNNLPTAAVLQPGNSLLERFIRSFWVTFSQNQNLLRALGIDQDVCSNLFSADALNANIHAFMNGMFPEIRQVLENGNFSFDDLVGLPRVAPDWPADGATIYLRLYTHRDKTHSDINDAAVYIGQSKLRLWVRHNDHENVLSYPTNSPHYRMANGSLPEHRHTVPVGYWNSATIDRLSDKFLDLAEQTMLSVFDSYHPLLFSATPRSDGASDTNMAQNRSHHSYIRTVTQQTCNATG